MDSLQAKFLYLIRLGLWGKAEPGTQIQLSSQEWTAIYQMARKQTVHGILFDAIPLLSAEGRPPKNVVLQGVLETDRLERENQKQIQELTRLRAFFQEKGVPFRLQKGQSIAQHYVHGNHRVCGDFDLWFGNGKNVEIANQLIEALGIMVQRGNHEDAIYEWEGIDVEHHSDLIELSSPLLKKKLRQWEQEVYAQSGDDLLPVANLLLQITHILKHLLTEGIGLRQMCDFAVSLQALDYDAEELKRKCKAYGIYKWTQLLLAFVHEKLGLPADKLPFAAKGDADYLLNEIWETGNFGHEDQRFGYRPTGKWASKLFTLKMFWQKQRMFFTYAPSESTWKLLLLVGNRSLQALHLIKEKPNYQ